MASSDPVTTPAKNGKRKRRGMAEESDSPFKMAQDPELRPALRAYLISLWGLLPPLGLVLGPVAFGLGLWLRWQHRHNPAYRGKNMVIAAIVLGGSLWLTTWGGLALMVLGWSD